MKKTFIPMLLAAAITLTAIPVANVLAAGPSDQTNRGNATVQGTMQGQQGGRRGGARSVPVNDGACSILSTTQARTAPLTQAQTEDLIFMWQEEKLAHDVYAKLAATWDLRVFDNIGRSEQQHMDTLKALLDRYGVAIPVAATEAGQYSIGELQKLYDQLITQGAPSANAALKVGVVIEETDIKDLDTRMVQAPADVAAVFAHLKQASTNHLAAFSRNLDLEKPTPAASNGQGQGRLMDRGTGSSQAGRGAGRVAGR